jgi:hypothetical protein
MASPTQMHNVLCRSVTIETRFTASSLSGGSHRNWTDLYWASNSRVGGSAVEGAVCTGWVSQSENCSDWPPNPNMASSECVDGVNWGRKWGSSPSSNRGPTSKCGHPCFCVFQTRNHCGWVKYLAENHIFLPLTVDRNVITHRWTKGVLARKMFYVLLKFRCIL